MNHPNEPRECVPRIDDLVAALKGKAFVLREPVASVFFDGLEPAWRRLSLTFLEDAGVLNSDDAERRPDKSLHFSVGHAWPDRQESIGGDSAHWLILSSCGSTWGGLLGGVSIDKTGLTGRYTMELAYTFPPPPDAWWRARSPTMD